MNDVWKASEFHLHIHVDKLMSLKLVTFDVIIKWVFKILVSTKGDQQIYWRLLFIIVDKVIARTNFIKQTYLQNKDSESSKEETLEHIKKSYEIV